MHYERIVTQYKYSLRVTCAKDPAASLTVKAFDKGIDDIISCSQDPLESLNTLGKMIQCF